MLISQFKFISILFSTLFLISNGSYLPVEIEQITLDNPGFASFIPSTVNNKYHLAISTFSVTPFSRDHVYYIPNYSGLLTSNTIDLNHQSLIWPNEVGFSGASIISPAVDPFGGLLVSAGFLVPSKNNGGIFYYPFKSADRSTVSTEPPIQLTYKTSTNWFYHRTKLVDLGGDGGSRLDILTCRTSLPVARPTMTQLIGLVLNEATLTFEEKIIINETQSACDVFFDATDIDGDGRFEIVAAGYFTAKLTLIYSDDPKNSFLNGNVHVKIIDQSGDKFFDVQAADLDADKSPILELLVTNHQGNADSIKGAIYFYRLIGTNYRTGSWSRTTVYDNFPVVKPSPQEAAPGSAFTLYPLKQDEETKNTRPYLLVAGDGSEKMYLFEPSPLGSPLRYSLIWGRNFEDTVGGFSIADIDGDGVNEFAVAIYEKHATHVFKLVNNV